MFVTTTINPLNVTEIEKMSEDVNNGNSFDKPTVVLLSETQLKELNKNMVARTPRKSRKASISLFGDCNCGTLQNTELSFSLT